MGLDLDPMSKPRPGHEAEFRKLFNRIMSFADERDMTTELERVQAISVVPHATAEVPRVGYDDVATQTARDRYREAEDPDMSEEAYLESAHGVWLLELVPVSDGLPYYSNSGLGLASRLSFRGECLVAEDVVEALENPYLLERLHEPMLADELAAVGAELAEEARRLAGLHGAESLLTCREPPEDVAEDSDPRHVVHVLASAARWCAWWSSRGHGMEPSY